jgi:hypothetical protein
MTSGKRAGGLGLLADAWDSNNDAFEVRSSTVALPAGVSTRL